MRTKPILQFITLSAVALAASIQPVFAANVVGYYNIWLVPGWNRAAVSLIQVDGYNANKVLGAAGADGSLIYRFNPETQDYYHASTRLTGVGWYPLSGDTNDPVLNLPLGEGFFIWTPTDWVATIVGEVAQGRLTNPLPANFSLKASMTPQQLALTPANGFPICPGDQLWLGAPPAFSPYYFSLDSEWNPPSPEPTLAVGHGFFLYRTPEQATPDHWWVRNFTVQFAPSPPARARSTLVATDTSPPAELRKLSFSDGKVVLAIRNDRGAPYNVQFSPDGLAWQTVATGQTATLWQEPVRAGVQGYYQLVNP